MAELCERLGTWLGPEPSQSSDRRSKGPCLKRPQGSLERLLVPEPRCRRRQWWRSLVRLQRGGGLGRDEPPRGLAKARHGADDRRTTVMTVGMMTL